MNIIWWITIFLFPLFVINIWNKIFSAFYFVDIHKVFSDFVRFKLQKNKTELEVLRDIIDNILKDLESGKSCLQRPSDLVNFISVLLPSNLSTIVFVIILLAISFFVSKLIFYFTLYLILLYLNTFVFVAMILLPLVFFYSCKSTFIFQYFILKEIKRDIEETLKKL